MYAKYSDNYVSGQRLTDSTINYLYWKELHDCAKANSYMGLWQIAQAANVLNVAIQSVYPEGRDSLMRHHFNRWFFPISCRGDCADQITLMWTSIQKNAPPMHFVPLLPKQTKYAHVSPNIN